MTDETKGDGMTLAEKIASMPFREERLGGQRTKYLQRDEVLAMVEVHLSRQVSVSDEDVWLALEKFWGLGIPRDQLGGFHMMRAALEAAIGGHNRCEYCDDTGDVHGIDGEWRGVCTACNAAKAIGKPQP